MAVLTIVADWDSDVHYDGTTYTKRPDITVMLVGLAGSDPKILSRAAIRFSLADLPVGSTVTQVRLFVRCWEAGAAAHLTDIHPYNDDGQADPETDSAQQMYNRCAPAGTPYVNDSDALRTVTEKWFDLGSQACTDVGNAKSAVNRFSLGLHEEGDNDWYAGLNTREDPDGAYRPKLEITYTPPPPVGYQYSDGLVSIQVAG